ncbi:hypothetical protein Q1695_007485 [Nippostrongylus brasiliensis]|nr:hypothetical protein Q1695_007485 [Nippostrongylus brasiliensis]
MLPTMSVLTLLSGIAAEENDPSLADSFNWTEINDTDSYDETPKINVSDCQTENLSKFVSHHDHRIREGYMHCVILDTSNPNHCVQLLERKEGFIRGIYKETCERDNETMACACVHPCISNKIVKEGNMTVMECSPVSIMGAIDSFRTVEENEDVKQYGDRDDMFLIDDDEYREVWSYFKNYMQAQGMDRTYARETFVHLTDYFNPLRQTEYYGVSHFVLILVLISWLTLCLAILFKTLQFSARVMMGIRNEDE